MVTQHTLVPEQAADPRRRSELAIAARLFQQANALFGQDRWTEAAALYREVIRRDPEESNAYYNLGNALHETDRDDGAAAAYRAAIALDPGHASAYANLGVALCALNRAGAAVALHRRAVALAPERPNNHVTLANALLQQGAFEEGLRHFERRWDLPNFPSPRRDFAQPQWDGRPFPGRTLLVYAEQGFGDAIQFCRFLPQVAAMGGPVVVECRAPLAGLLRRLPGVAQVVERGAPLPAFDLHIPMLSLGLACGTTAATIPATVPYLHSDPAYLAKWRPALPPRQGFKVGLVWAGNPAHRNDRRRSMPAGALRDIAWPAGTILYSLQKGDGEGQLSGSTGAAPVFPLGRLLADFDDLAAVIDLLDLVISVDTAPAHLAGALGKTVWTLLPFAAEWRWMMDRPDSPWYPTMRLFRQSAPGDWAGVVGQVAAALAREAGAC